MNSHEFSAIDSKNPFTGHIQRIQRRSPSHIALLRGQVTTQHPVPTFALSGLKAWSHPREPWHNMEPMMVWIGFGGLNGRLNGGLNEI